MNNFQIYLTHKLINVETLANINSFSFGKKKRSEFTVGDGILMHESWIFW